MRRIAKRIGILIFLGSCFFLIDKSHISLANGCPERDQCLDQASADYNATMAQLNQEWQACDQQAVDMRNSCLDSAHQEYYSCMYWVEMEYNYMVGRCEQVSDPHQQQICFDNAWTHYLQSAEACQSDFDGTNNACWGSYYDESQFCADVFYAEANQAQQQYSNDVDYCNTLCP